VEVQSGVWRSEAESWRRSLGAEFECKLLSIYEYILFIEIGGRVCWGIAGGGAEELVARGQSESHHGGEPLLSEAKFFVGSKVGPLGAKFLVT
jgi:hypothetical protein